MSRTIDVGRPVADILSGRVFPFIFTLPSGFVTRRPKRVALFSFLPRRRRIARTRAIAPKRTPLVIVYGN